MSDISEQRSGPVSVDTGFRVTGPESIDKPDSSDLPEPGEGDVTLGPSLGTERWNLPGYGESGSRCGEVLPTGVCEHGHIDWGEHQCGRRTCPKCWLKWSREASVRATVRIQARRETLPDDHNRQTGHFVWSPEDGDIVNKRDYWNGCSRAAEIAEEKGMPGFAVIPHPWRPTEAAKELFGIEKDDSPDLGMWKFLREEVDEVVMRELIEFSPHYHVIGLMSEDMEAGRMSDDGVWRFIRSVERYDGRCDRESHEDLYGLFRYLLSHTGWPVVPAAETNEGEGRRASRKQVTRWYGDLANNVFVDDANEEWQIQKPEPATEIIRREVEAIAGVQTDDEGDGADDSERETCDREGCEAEVIEVEGLRVYLAENDPPEPVRDRMRAVKEWRYSGLVGVQPGLKRPQTVEEGEEAIEALVASRKVFQS